MSQFIVAKVGGSEHTGGGKRVYLNRKDKIDHVFENNAAAIKAAKERAIAEPGQQFAVMGIIHIFETGKPVIIEKEVNEAGEIVLKQKESA